ncbi:unnamed protein product [Hymenolepis diminuta]|uniref:Ankyrin repeat protein n=3 Tax=Hymenolepis diminuta TaxID=6216 RepID=A0A0R3SFA4_HYMDI|nr:unnamed protein product [Hymenolepis diminuta]
MLLLESNARLEGRNISGWRPIDELVATGNELLAREGYKLFRDQLSKNGQSTLISQMLRDIPDCILDFGWEFRTWIPFVARHLPSDNCRLFKKDNLLRLDTTLLDFKDRDWVRGQLSIVVDANKPFESRICLIDHEHRSYQVLDGTMMREKSDDWLNETVQTSLHMPLVRMHVDFSNLSCRKETSKMRWRKESTTEMIGSYNTQSYSVNHVKMCVKKRSEHLRKEDIRFLSTLKTHLKQGTVSSAVELVQDRAYNKNSGSENITESCQRLLPRVSWEAYRSWELTGNNLFIGRKPNLKLQSNDMKLTVVMTNDIDFKITYLVDMFKCFSPLRKFTKLDETILDSLPSGFPVRIDVPVAPSVTGRVTFNNVELYEPGKRTSTGIILQDEVFRVPVGYVSSEVL